MYGKSILDKINGVWHKPANQLFLVIVLAHWAEHLVQAFQVYAFNWPRTHSHGLIGYVIPWLNTSEWLHYGYAIIMLGGLIVLRPGFNGRSRIWWNMALAIQAWHFFEHALLITQSLFGINFFGSPDRTSILQLVIPRVELHLFYNAIVFIPMVVAMLYHLYPPESETNTGCICGHSRHGVVRSGVSMQKSI